MASSYLVDQFVTTTPGDAYRFFPFGTIHKGGESRELTPELAAEFKLPHFKPAIKLGGHDDELPAGGHIIGLEVREDGLYVIPEWNDSGTAAITAGAYRYHSPEVIWEGSILDSSTGEEIQGPLILGDALLHNPALGEATAFYSVEKQTVNSESNGGNNMSENMVSVPASTWDRFMALFLDRESNEPEPQQQPPEPQNDEYAAQVQTLSAKVDEYEAKIERMEAEREAAARVANFAVELKETVVADDVEIQTALAGMDEDTAKMLVTKFKALSAQIEESNLTGEIGSSGDPKTSGSDAVLAEAKKYSAEQGVSFNDAITFLAQTRPELFGGN